MEVLFVGEMMDVVEMQVMDCDELSVFFAKNIFYLMSSHDEYVLFLGHPEKTSMCFVLFFVL